MWLGFFSRQVSSYVTPFTLQAALPCSVLTQPGLIQVKGQCRSEIPEDPALEHRAQTLHSPHSAAAAQCLFGAAHVQGLLMASADPSAASGMHLPPDYSLLPELSTRKTHL